MRVAIIMRRFLLMIYVHDPREDVGEPHEYMILLMKECLVYTA